MIPFSYRSGGFQMEVLLSQLPNQELSAALLGFNGEATVYCEGISDQVAQEYAIQYARMIEDRAKGLETALPKIPRTLFEPNRKWIHSSLEQMRKKYFPR
jgi:hypothetical protein